MADLDDKKYNVLRSTIRNIHENGKSWEEIISMSEDTENNRAMFDARINGFDCWPKDSMIVWSEIAITLRDHEKSLKRYKEVSRKSTLLGPNQLNDLEPPENEDSCWAIYRSKLVKKGFTNIDCIEAECLTILRNLSRDTTGREPVKGMVVGNVQSGKTANMAGLIAMAADYGWNFFIVLSGTINSLREQTRDRLYNDLNDDACKCSWQRIDLLNTKKTENAPELMHLSENNAERYLTVSLKNKTRLNDILKWINLNPAKKKQMRILVIDDEADQASINTAAYNKDRKAINKAIVNLVAGKNHKGEDAGPYGAMNYVGYTATPYANFLSEGSEVSLYPRDFITLLTPPNVYFGPVQIHGFDERPGLSIVNTYEDVDVAMGEYMDGDIDEIPTGLKDAICWFICCVAVLRKEGAKHPASMLIHTSQYVSSHAELAEGVNEYLTSQKDDVVERCRKIYREQTEQFPLSLFKDEYPDYSLMDKVHDYPEYSEIEELVKDLVRINPGHIKMDDSDRYYHNGIHICIDNNTNTSLDEDERSLPRLLYPTDKQEHPPVTAFIVIGGNTLSRGLTVEGLVSTYFSRKSKQADTIMQMGRWFGYRKGYELLPRIWISERTRDSFEQLVIVDEDLRRFIRENYDTFSPRDYPPRVRRFPKSYYIKSVTSSEKMRAAEVLDVDFSGTICETNLFSRDTAILRKNKAITEEFLTSLGTPEKSQINKCDWVWRNVSGSTLFTDYLERYVFDKALRNFKEMDDMRKWIHRKSSNHEWNVVLAGVSTSKHEPWSFNGIEVNKVERSSKNNVKDDDKSVYIGTTLSSPIDRVADIDLKGHEEDHSFKHSQTYIRSQWREIRKDYGLFDTPSVIIYCISKDSEPSPTKWPLEVEEDIIGMTIVIPGIKKTKDEEYIGIPVEVVRGDE